VTDKPINDATGWFDRKENVTLIVRVLYVVCAVVLLADIVARSKFETEIESLFGFFGIYSFVGSVVLVLAARVILQRIVTRPEDYYDD
jgi:hypothetical protein